MGAHLGRCSFTEQQVESWYASLPKLLPPPTAVFASAQALSKLDHTAREPVRKLESSDAFSGSKTKPAYVENAGRR